MVQVNTPTHSPSFVHSPADGTSESAPVPASPSHRPLSPSVNSKSEEPLDDRLRNAKSRCEPDPTALPIPVLLSKQRLLNGLKQPPSPESSEAAVIALQYADHSCELLQAEAFMAEQRYRQLLISTRVAELHATKARIRANEAVQDLERAWALSRSRFSSTYHPQRTAALSSHYHYEPAPSSEYHHQPVPTASPSISSAH